MAPPLRGSTVMIHGNGLASAPDPACQIWKGHRALGDAASTSWAWRRWRCDAPSPTKAGAYYPVAVAADASAVALLSTRSRSLTLLMRSW